MSPPGNEDRPRGVASTRAADSMGGAVLQEYPRPRVDARIVVDLRRRLTRDPHAAGRAIEEAAHAPTGSTVVLVVSRGQWAPPLSMAYLVRHGASLGAVIVECEDPITAARWVDALTRGDGVIGRALL